MDPEVAFHTNEGSQAAQTALAVLAQSLNVNESALKVALGHAFDLLPIVGYIPLLALQQSVDDLHYPVDGSALSMVVSDLRGTFGAALSVEQRKSDGEIRRGLANEMVETPTRVPTTQMCPNSYRDFPGANASRYIPTAQMNPNPYRAILPKAPPVISN